LSIYLSLTREFNAGRLRTIVCSGQPVVLLRLAVASKDGDWILREDQESLDHVLRVLEAHGARYRFGAPLDLRWLRAGWSSHFEFASDGLRIRTDFFTRPPRVSAEVLANLWRSQEGRDPPFTTPEVLAAMKMTGREKDWPFVGELARLVESERDRFLLTQSARDLVGLAAGHPALARELAGSRPAIAAVTQGEQAVEIELDRERRRRMAEDRTRIHAYVQAAVAYAEAWSSSAPQLEGLPLHRAHELAVDWAQKCLPTTPPDTSSALE
jgi:hypothetical protein